MNNLMEKLNPEQLKAVTHKDGPLLIVAGAGTGKTTVITQKIAYMIEQDWVKADEILALTFTEKAAGEMEERVDKLLPMGYVDLWVSTFHSFAERILGAHGLDIGLPSDFKLLNEFEQWALIKKNLEKFKLDYYRPAGNPTKFIRALLKHFSRLKDEDISPEQYLDYAEELKQNLDNMLSGAKGKSPLLAKEGIKGRSRDATQPHPNPLLSKERGIAEQEVTRINEVANAYHVYQQLLLNETAMDFGDLINYCLKLFRERPAILEKYRQQFKYILVDEFQDTNWSQYELVKMLASPKDLPAGKAGNLTVVGDDDQSVYAFRGASMSNILHFKKDYPQAEQVVLVKNYRNRQNILDLSYEFIKLNNPNRLEYQLSQKKESKQGLNKKLVAQKKGKGMMDVIYGENLNDEVSQVVEKIAELKIEDKEAVWSDFAILVRANEAAKEFIGALETAGLPYQFLASRGLYAKPVIMDIIAYLKLLDDYHESRAMYRVLNLPIFSFSYRELVSLNFAANKKSWSLYEVLRNAAGLSFKEETQKKINKVLSLIAKQTALVREKTAGEVIVAFLEDSGYLKYLTSQSEQKGREAVACLNQFIKRVFKFQDGSDDKSVKAFLEELNMEIDAGEEGGLAPDLEIGPETIKIMTVHGAKGLEFKYVFIVNMVDKRFPTIERKEQIAIPDALIKEILPTGDIHLEEERRLFYVAMTRAKDGLFFSWAPDYGGARKKKPSRFLEEAELISAGKSRKELKRAEKIFASAVPPDPSSRHAGLEMTMPFYFSYTQLAAFSNCPYQYRFAHILRVPIRGKAVFSFGKTMHSVLQKIFEKVKEGSGFEQGDLFGDKDAGNRAGEKGGGIAWEDISKLYEQSWIDDWYESKRQKEEYKEKGKNILKDFLEKHKNNWPKTVFTEKGFKMKVPLSGDLYTVRGMMDRIDETKEKLKIVDYKTGSPKKKLSFKEKEQLLIYQLAARDLFSQPVGSVAFYYLEDNSEVEFLGTEDELAKTKDKIIKTINEIKKGEFPPKPSLLCKYCDYKDICEYRKL